MTRERLKLLNRIKRLRGQLAAVERALSEESDDCPEVLMQLAAVRGGVNSLMAEVLEDHIRLHLGGGGGGSGGGDPEAAEGEGTAVAPEIAEELIDLVRAYLK